MQQLIESGRKQESGVEVDMLGSLNTRPNDPCRGEDGDKGGAVDDALANHWLMIFIRQDEQNCDWVESQIATA